MQAHSSAAAHGRRGAGGDAVMDAVRGRVVCMVALGAVKGRWMRGEWLGWRVVGSYPAMRAVTLGCKKYGFLQQLNYWPVRAWPSGRAAGQKQRTL